VRYTGCVITHILPFNLSLALKNCSLYEQALADPYFSGLSQPGREPSAQPVSKVAFDFERRKLSSNDVSFVPLWILSSLERGER